MIYFFNPLFYIAFLLHVLPFFAVCGSDVAERMKEQKKFGTVNQVLYLVVEQI